MRTPSILRILTLLLFTIACFSFKAPGGWEKLGEKKVDYKIDRDVINVSYRDGTFKKLRFVVTKGSLNMHNCVVHFANGEEQDINLKHDFTRGSLSREIDLQGNNRFIDKITFWYDTKGYSNNKAELAVWGK